MLDALEDPRKKLVDLDSDIAKIVTQKLDNGLIDKGVCTTFSQVRILLGEDLICKRREFAKEIAKIKGEREDSRIFVPHVEHEKIETFISLCQNVPAQFAKWFLQMIMNDSKNAQWKILRKETRAPLVYFLHGISTFSCGNESFRLGQSPVIGGGGNKIFWQEHDRCLGKAEKENTPFQLTQEQIIIDLDYFNPLHQKRLRGRRNIST